MDVCYLLWEQFYSHLLQIRLRHWITAGAWDGIDSPACSWIRFAPIQFISGLLYGRTLASEKMYIKSTASSTQVAKQNDATRTSLNITDYYCTSAFVRVQFDLIKFAFRFHTNAYLHVNLLYETRGGIICIIPMLIHPSMENWNVQITYFHYRFASGSLSLFCGMKLWIYALDRNLNKQ